MGSPRHVGAKNPPADLVLGVFSIFSNDSYRYSLHIIPIRKKYNGIIESFYKSFCALSEDTFTFDRQEIT